MLARTPVCPPQPQQDETIASNPDASLAQVPVVVGAIFPPPPSSSELLEVEDFSSREVSPDLPPPPDVQNDTHVDQEIGDSVKESGTSDVRDTNKLPTGRQLARTPHVKAE